MIQDLRYSVRLLIRSPGFALAAILSLMLGIGATTAVFSVIYAALINSYPFTAADRIMRMSVQTKDGSVDTVNLNPGHIQQLRDVSLIESVLAPCWSCGGATDKHSTTADADFCWPPLRPTTQHCTCAIELKPAKTRAA